MDLESQSALPKSAEEKAQEELDAYQDFMLDPEIKKILTTPTRLLTWWRTTGSVNFPILAQVARAALAVPPSSAVLERDFSVVSNLLTAKRSTLDPYWVEMTMLLHCNQECIPQFIPKLTKEQVKKRLPKRFTDPRFIALHSDDEVAEVEVFEL